jgi:hypothetical protein
MQGPSQNLLKSWKEIAEYVGVSVRTAQRWKRAFGLPVHRLGDKHKSGVLAQPGEIEQWLNERVNGLGHPPVSIKQEELPANLADVLITSELQSRPSRPHDCERESEACRHLIQMIGAQETRTVLGGITRWGVDLCRADSCAISVLEKDENGEEKFRLLVATGFLKAFEGQLTAARNDAPCGIALERNAPQIFRNPGGLFPFLQRLGTAPNQEYLTVPIYGGMEHVGTLWVISQGASHRKFDREDVRILTRLAEVAAAVFRTMPIADSQKKSEELR